MFGSRIDEDLINRVNNLASQYPKIPVSLIVETALDHVTNLSPDKFRKLISEYLTRRDDPKNGKKK
jgi:hypothetical protein